MAGRDGTSETVYPPSNLNHLRLLQFLSLPLHVIDLFSYVYAQRFAFRSRISLWHHPARSQKSAFTSLMGPSLGFFFIPTFTFVLSNIPIVISFKLSVELCTCTLFTLAVWPRSAIAISDVACNIRDKS